MCTGVFGSPLEVDWRNPYLVVCSVPDQSKMGRLNIGGIQRDRCLLKVGSTERYLRELYAPALCRHGWNCELKCAVVICTDAIRDQSNVQLLKHGPVFVHNFPGYFPYLSWGGVPDFVRVEDKDEQCKIAGKGATQFDIQAL